MVQMPVSTHDGLYLSSDLFHHPVIGYYTHIDKVPGIYPVYLYIFMYLDPVETESHIHYDDFFTHSYCGHVAAHFIIAAYCCNAYFCH